LPRSAIVAVKSALGSTDAIPNRQMALRRRRAFRPRQPAPTRMSGRADLPRRARRSCQFRIAGIGPTRDDSVRQERLARARPRRGSSVIQEFFASVAFLLAAQVAHADVIDRIRESGTIRLAHRTDAAPFASLDAA